MEAEKIYVDDILSDEDDECPSPIIPKKYIEKEEFESRKSKLDIKKIISSFILKKEYFVSHKKTDIHVDYDLEKEPLGEGAFGVVYRATERETGIIRAAKKIQVKDDSDIENFYREVGALKTLDHPNVIKLYEVYEDKEEGFVYLIEEYCEGGELFDYIIDHNGLEEKEAARVFHQMLSSILY